MANRQISGLDADTTPARTDVLPKQDAAGAVEAQKSTIAQVLALSTVADISDASANGRSLVSAANYAAMRALLDLEPGTDVQAQDAELSAIAGLTSAADKGIQFTGSGTAATYDLTTAGKALLDDADATAQRATLGLVIGTNVQAQDAELAAIAGLTSAADSLPYFTGSGTAALATFTAAGRALVDDADAAAQLTTLGAAAASHTHTLADVTDAGALAAQNTIDDILPTQTGHSGEFLTTDGTNASWGTPSGSGNSFTTIAVSGQSDVVADAAADTLTLAAGSNITITTNATTDTVTIAASGSTGYGTVQEDATPLTQRDTINFGTGLTASDDAGNSRTNVVLASHTHAVADLSDASANGRSLVSAADYAAMRALLDLEPGTDVQAQDAELAAIAGLTSAADRLPYFTGSGTASLATFTAAGRALVDDADAAAQLTTLGAAAASHTHTLDGLSDVAITTPATGHILVYQTDTWVNQAELSVSVAGVSDGYVLGRTGGAPAWRSPANVLSDIGAQAADAELSAIAGLTSAADKGIQFTGSGTAATYDLTAAGKALLDDADNTAQRATLGLVIGTNVQAFDAELAAIAGLTSAADKGIQFTGSGTAATYDLTAAGKALLDDASAAAQRTTLAVDVFSMLLHIETVAVKAYYFTLKAPRAFTINSATHRTMTSGSCTFDIEIDGTNVTGLTNLTCDSTESEDTASGANSVAAGDTVTLNVLTNTAALDAVFELKITLA